MTHTRSAVLLTALLALVPILAHGQPVDDHSDKPIKTITITPTRLNPPDLTMGTGDVLAFQNLSQKMMQLTFLQPKHVGQYTTCTNLKRVSAGEATAPGALFQRQGDEVTALIAPGTVVSVCSLKAGVYVYTAVDALGTNPDEQLGMKGTVTVK